MGVALGELVLHPAAVTPAIRIERIIRTTRERTGRIPSPPLQLGIAQLDHGRRARRGLPQRPGLAQPVSDTGDFLIDGRAHPRSNAFGLAANRPSLTALAEATEAGPTESHNQAVYEARR